MGRLPDLEVEGQSMPKRMEREKMLEYHFQKMYWTRVMVSRG
jgi:hypothetical protein